MLAGMDVDEIADNFELLPDWNERYRYLIELGRALPTMPDHLKTAENKVAGCMSQVWLAGSGSTDRIDYVADSDAFIVRGLVSILLTMFSGKSARVISDLDPKPLFARLGFDTHLSPGRNTGLHSMVGRMKQIAQGHLDRK